MFNIWYINFDVVNKVLFIVYEFIFCSMEERMYWLILRVSISLLRVWAQKISKLKYKVGLLNLLCSEHGIYFFSDLQFSFIVVF